jgi:hypothetical protein
MVVEDNPPLLAAAQALDGTLSKRVFKEAANRCGVRPPVAIAANPNWQSPVLHD